jgi:hypothetical protein
MLDALITIPLTNVRPVAVVAIAKANRKTPHSSTESKHFTKPLILLLENLMCPYCYYLYTSAPFTCGYKSTHVWCRYSGNTVGFTSEEESGKILQCPPSLLFDGYQGAFTVDKAAAA